MLRIRLAADAAAERLAFRIRRIGPQKGDFTPRVSELRIRGVSAGVAYAHIMFEDSSRAGCGLVLAHIAYFAKWGL